MIVTPPVRVRGSRSDRGEDLEQHDHEQRVGVDVAEAAGARKFTRRDRPHSSAPADSTPSVGSSLVASTHTRTRAASEA